MGDLTMGMAAAARRAAEVLLRGAGGREVLLRMPTPAVAGDVREQLGLGQPAFQDVVLGPVAFRKTRPKNDADGAAEWELMVAATTVDGLLNEQAPPSSAEVLFAVAAGVVVDGTVLEILSVSSSDVAGDSYVYRIRLRAPVAATV